jgi:hypothetical protein
MKIINENIRLNGHREHIEYIFDFKLSIFIIKNRGSCNLK